MSPAGGPDTIGRWLGHARYEVLPLEGAEERVLGAIATDIKVTVTASPRKGLDSTLVLAERLAGHGYLAVPHLSARLVVDGSHLDDVVERLREARIREIFVVAGDAGEPAGQFQGSLELLQALHERGHSFDDIGIAGYPESHPLIDDDITIQSMWDKRRFATCIVSNICFDAKVIIRWVKRVRRRGVELPIYVGLPSITDTAKLLRVSQKIGVGDSARFLTKSRGGLLRLVVPGGYNPTRLLEKLAPDLGEPALGVPGVHIYTFNDFEQTETWRRQTMEARLQG
ncbi:MAG: methylenetetrahydrofolate reductase [Actinomycetota bacterium]|nr:methylenetetrahydrofolate reductase [Actinomycetota bacterium]